MSEQEEICGHLIKARNVLGEWICVACKRVISG